MMDLCLTPKDTTTLLPTDILFQTSYWGHVKSNTGWRPYAFDLVASGSLGDVLVFTKILANGVKAAYVPQGPEHSPDRDQYGYFLEQLSEHMLEQIEPGVSFIRYDLPWECQYADETSRLDGPAWRGRPETRLRELRMNFGTKSWIWKAPIDLTVADTIILDLEGEEKDILLRMKPKTRYNIHLSERKGVKVFECSGDSLPAFYGLYMETSHRNGFPASDYAHFAALFSALNCTPRSCDLHFLLATHRKEVLAGAIIAISGSTATYLFGASSSRNRNLMAPYAIQWEAIRISRGKSCRNYDMGAVPATLCADHPFYGMYRFKAGFGGTIKHRTGSWDVPVNLNRYMDFRNAEILGPSLPQIQT